MPQPNLFAASGIDTLRDIRDGLDHLLLINDAYKRLEEERDFWRDKYYEETNKSLSKSHEAVGQMLSLMLLHNIQLTPMEEEVEAAPFEEQED